MQDSESQQSGKRQKEQNREWSGVKKNKKKKNELGSVPEKEVLYSVDVVKAILEIQIRGSDVGILQSDVCPVLARR